MSEERWGKFAPPNYICKHCVSWEPNKGGSNGTCHSPHHIFSPPRVDGNDNLRAVSLAKGGWFKTGKYYGCVHFERRAEGDD